MKFLYSIGNFLQGVANFAMQFTWIDDAVVITKMTYMKWFHPVVRFIIPPARGVKNFYVWSFKKMAYTNGEVNHKKAAAVAVPILVVSTWFTVFHIIPESVDFIRDGAGVLTEREHKGIYLTGAGPAPGNMDEDEFIAKGCPVLPCTDENANYYHIRENSVKSVIRFVTSGTVYYPEEVEAAIPDQLSKCDITVQWFRWRLFRVYNVLSEVSCQPLHDNE